MMTLLNRFYTVLTATLLCLALTSHTYISHTPYSIFSFTFSFDGLAFLLTCLAALVFFMMSIMSHFKSQAYVFWLVSLQVFLTLLFMSQDFISFYILWELVVVSGFVLFYGYRESRNTAVFNRFLIYSFASSLLLLASLLFCFYSNGFSLLFSSMPLLALNGVAPWLFCVLIVSVAIKTPLFPFHSWQPDVYRDSDIKTTILFASLFSKIGLLLVCRLLLPLSPWLLSSGLNYLGVGLGLVTLLYAGSLALIETDLKRLLAFSSMSHLGLIVAAFFTGNSIGIHGAIFQLVSHGIITLGLFWMVMLISDFYGTTRIQDINGIREKSPFFASIFLVFVLASIGFPLTSGFVSEFLMILGIFKLNWIYSFVALFSVVLSAWYMLKLVATLLYGHMSDVVRDRDFAFDVKHALGLSFLLGIILILGVFPMPILSIITDYLKYLGPLISHSGVVKGVLLCGL